MHVDVIPLSRDHASIDGEEDGLPPFGRPWRAALRGALHSQTRRVTPDIGARARMAPTPIQRRACPGLAYPYIYIYIYFFAVMMPLRSPCVGRSRAVLAWLPAAAARAESVAEVHRERSWMNQRCKMLADPAMSLRRRWETHRMRERRTSTAVDRLGGDAQGLHDQPASRCMIELGSSSS